MLWPIVPVGSLNVCLSPLFPLFYCFSGKSLLCCCFVCVLARADLTMSHKVLAETGKLLASLSLREMRQL